MSTETPERKPEKPSPQPKPPKKINIHIDRKPYKVTAEKLTGTEIRAIPEPPVGPEFDLWLEVPGGEDEKIGNDQVVKLEEGMHFFSAHSHINPGSC